MILDLARQGLTVTAISRRTGHDRKTIRKYIARGLEPPAYQPRAVGPGLIRPFEAYLRERLERLRTEREAQGDYIARAQAFVRKHAHLFDRRPVTKQEWDEAVGDTPEELGFPK